MLNKTLFSALFLCCLGLTACNKILQEKSDLSLGIPNSLKNLQAMLDYPSMMNTSSSSCGEGATDNLYIPDEMLAQKDENSIDAYVWKPYDHPSAEWSNLYNTIYVANIVIEKIQNITAEGSSRDSWNNIYGSALFYRANAYLQGVFTYCRGYDASTAMDNFGMVMRLASDFNQHVTRSNLQTSYQQIIKDLKLSIHYLPIHPITNFRPSKVAAYGLLARTYLSMREYGKCLLYADSCLDLKNDLLDFNSIDGTQTTPFSYDNPEIIFYGCIGSFGSLTASPLRTRVDSLLYESFEEYDLRKSVFFRSSAQSYIFKGTYSANRSNNFTGIATDEVYLMRAECLARTGKVGDAIQDLNTILVKRWQTGTFVPLIANSGPQALNLILKARRKELMYRGLRWMDIKRLNLEGYNIILHRLVNGQVYTLNPNDPFYALPLPSDIVEDYGIAQNIY